jgi:hypothetical protein
MATLQAKGYGVDPASAEQKAFEDAASELDRWLAENRPDITGWEPSPDYVRQRGMARVDGEPRDVEIEPVGGFHAAKEVRLEVDVRVQDLDDMAWRARHHRMEERQVWAGRGLAGAVALLLVVAGLLHLEEWTRGYYSRLLRLGAVALVIALIVAGVVMLG